MFVNIIYFPPIKPGKDNEFREWFAWSNVDDCGEVRHSHAKHKGFISRRLLKPRESGNYAAVVEHESYETFWAMHTSPTQAEAGKRVMPMLDGNPKPEFYEVVIG
ncbi:MAG: antibiotic biosynthesis monooxygenase [Chloroflexota bacterium]|nr:antibiotic biosynthesis monooxygenase [Chloroflexota bacterium]